MTLLHRLRLGLYFCILFLPLLHPAVSFPASWPILWRLFAVLPGAALLAYSLSGAAPARRAPPAFATLPALGIAATLLVGTIVLQGFSLSTMRTLLAATFAFLLSFGIYRRTFAALALFEPLAWGWAVLRILGFSSASVQVAQESRSVFPFLSGAVAGGVLLLLWAIFRARAEQADHRESATSAASPSGQPTRFSSFPPRSPVAPWYSPARLRKPATWTGLWLAAVLLAFLAGMAALPRVVPPETIDNPLAEALRPEPTAIPGSAEGGDPDGNLQGDEAGLYEAPAGEWGSGDAGRQGRPGQQSLVMVVESPLDRAYLAQYYFVRLDPQDGFQLDQDEALNRLPGDRYLETWTNALQNAGRSRTPHWTRVWSVNSERVAPYWPYLLEPAIRDDRYAPLSYSYRVLSLFSTTGADRAPPFLPSYGADQLSEMAAYLDMPLSEQQVEPFQRHLDSYVDPQANLSLRISSLLQSFAQFQYKAGFTDDLRVEALRSFLTDTRTGDCTEFSNAAAILARLAGIPSRVVTGYLLADHLQTDAHRQGVRELRAQIPSLAEADPADLYLISDVHRHSWVQLFLPQQGWVDFEATTYALPPEGDDDPNSLALVIPQIQPRPVPSSLRFFGDFLQALAVLLLFSAVLWYCRRWALLLRLHFAASRPGEVGARALERLVLIEASTRGRPVKLPSQTLTEYAVHAPELRTFARIYSAARYRTEHGALARVYPTLAAEYRRIASSAGRILGGCRTILRPWDGGLL